MGTSRLFFQQRLIRASLDVKAYHRLRIRHTDIEPPVGELEAVAIRVIDVQGTRGVGMVKFVKRGCRVCHLSILLVETPQHAQGIQTVQILGGPIAALRDQPRQFSVEFFAHA